MNDEMHQVVKLKKVPDYAGLAQKWLASMERQALLNPQAVMANKVTIPQIELEPNAVIPLGDGGRIVLRYCRREHLWHRAQLLWRRWRKPLTGENLAVLVAYLEIISKLGPDDKAE